MKYSLKSNFLYNFIFGTTMKRVETFDRDVIMIEGDVDNSPIMNIVVTTEQNDYDNFSDIENNVLEETDADVDTRYILQSASGNSNSRNYLILFIISSITSLGGYLIHKYGKHMRACWPRK